jgi:hypothetical protein
MKDERFDELMRDAKATYRQPPEAPLDEMWKEIEREAFGARRRQTMSVVYRVLPIAATLVIGIALGRASARVGRPAAPLTPVVATHDSATRVIPASEPYQLETGRYLGQASALLTSLTTEMKDGRASDQFVSRAGDLLTTTRLLLDSPAASGQSMRGLLEDLELVLAQVVRLQDAHSRTELDLINQALEQRDVMPRLRTAAAEITAND